MEREIMIFSLIDKDGERDKGIHLDANKIDIDPRR